MTWGRVGVRVRMRVSEVEREREREREREGVVVKWKRTDTWREGGCMLHVSKEGE